MLSRWGISRLTLHSDALLWSTVAINLVGSFLLGLLVAGQWFSRDLREGLGVGFLGGFTTFSTFSVDTAALLRSGQSLTALTYLFGTVIVGLIATWTGIALARRAAGVSPRSA